MLCTRLWTKKTWPSRSSSRRIAAPICFSSYGADEREDRVPLLRRGGIVDISRMPVIAISSVRGIGVADMVEHVDVRSAAA